MDLQKPATRGDVHAAITEAISGLEARQDAKFATKTELREAFTRLDAKIDERFGSLDAKFGALDAKTTASTKSLAMAIVDTNSRLQEFKEQVTKAVSDNADRVLTALDHYTRIVEADNRGVTLHGEILTEVQLKLRSHDQRITALESRPLSQEHP